MLIILVTIEIMPTCVSLVELMQGLCLVIGNTGCFVRELPSSPSPVSTACISESDQDAIRRAIMVFKYHLSFLGSW